MKPLIFILFTFLTFSSFNAQKNYQETLSVLMKNSENDFVQIMGEKKGEEDDAIYFDSTVKLNIGYEFIAQSIQTKASMYVLSADYPAVKDLEKETQKFIRKHYSKSPYSISETQNGGDGLYTLEVWHESDVEAMIILQVGEEPANPTRFLMLSILGTQMKN